ncbi:MAG: outer membrane protein assembly factor BamD [Candidatus Omnitrophica bacterium]|nr:outer membrane protein assembly factor BamD [Candidatus Omnitrophota bacterium]
MRIGYLAFIFLIIFILPAYPFWVWSPKTGRWVNPKAEIKANPKQQFDYARGLYEAKHYPEAKQQFQRLIKAFPKSLQAAESQYYLGRIEEEQGNLYEAYLAYQKVIDKYPFSERIQEIIDREYKIAEDFMSGKKRKVFGVNLPVENPALEIFAKIIENSPYGPKAAAAQYKLGLLLKSLARYYEAEEAFNKVITNYPESEWVEAAKFQLASCRASLSRTPDYDQATTKEAKEMFEEFLKVHPDAVLAKEAEKNIAYLKEKEAESNYKIAQFYEKQKQYLSAKIYYSQIIDDYPDSLWAVKAFERLQILEKERK